MSDERFEVPKEVRAMAESSFDQARKAFESFLSTAQQTASSFNGTSETARANAKISAPGRSLTPRRTCRPRSLTPSS